MQTRNGQISSDKLAKLIVKGMQEKKAQDIVVLDLKGIKNAIADYFIVCSGTSDTQLKSISESIDEQVFKSASQSPWHKEGLENKEWILLDYVDVVAHIFLHDQREFYALENLWGDAMTTPVE